MQSGEATKYNFGIGKAYDPDEREKWTARPGDASIMDLKTQERIKLQPFKIKSGSAKGGGFVCLEAHNYRKEKLQPFSPRYHFQDRKTKRVEEAHKLVSKNGPGNHTPPARETFVKECPSLARQSTWYANKSTDIQDQHLRLSQQHVIMWIRRAF